MKLAVGLTLAGLATVSPALAGPGRMDVSKRAPRVSTEEKAVLPDNQPLERNEVLMDKRFDTGTYEKKDALVGERRSDIAVVEMRDKEFFATPGRKDFEKIERQESAWSGKQSRFSTSEDGYHSKMAIRFQEKIGEASPVVDKVTPVVSQRTTFDKINRFVFRKNGDQRVSVSTAGDERPAGDAGERSSPGPAAPNSSPQSPPAPLIGR